MTKNEKKERLKALKEQRRQVIDRVTRQVKENNAAIKKITRRLAEGPATIPELAEATGLNTRDTLWYVSALKKFGRVAEGTKKRGESYFPYLLAPDERENQEAAAK